MAIKNCPKCGKLYSDDSGIICALCRKADVDVYEKVRSYIKDNPDRTINEVAEATEVSQKKIIRYIREGKIEISSGMLDDVRCESCGKPVTSGRYCPECSMKLSIELQGSIAGQAPKPADIKKSTQGNPKMHTRNR